MTLWRCRAQLGAEVVWLDMSTPFTAARARNAGVQRALQLHPTSASLQFVDGDCEVDAGLARQRRAIPERASRAWPSSAAGAASATPSARSTTACATWSGTRRPANARACGGDVMMRVRRLGGAPAATATTDRRRGAGAVHPPARRRLDDSLPRRRDDAARCGDHALRPMVAPHHARRLRLRRRVAPARRAARAHWVRETRRALCGAWPFRR